MTKLLLFLCCSLGCSVYAADPVPIRLILEVGDLTPLIVEKGASLHLSQKKILEVNEAGAGRYQLIALRSGIVSVKALDAEGHTLQAWIVEVLSRSSEGRAEILRHPRWRAMICGEPGIICDRTSDSLSGQSESLPWLHKTRELCLKHPPCRWNASLSQRAQQLWSQLLAKELSLTQVSVGADGFVSVSMDCHNPDVKREEQLRRWIKDRYGAPAQVFCQQNKSAAFSLDVLALAHKSSHSSLDNPLQLGSVRLLPSQPIEVFLRGLSTQSDTKILARPQVALNLGSSIELSDGMEIASTTVQRDQIIENWKNVGFQLQLKLLEQHEQRVKVQVTLQLSRPHDGGRSLDRSSMQTETWLDLQDLQLVGHIEAETDGMEESRLPWLGDIPLLGALFRWQVASEGKSHVYLLLRVNQQKLLNPKDQDLDAARPKMSEGS